MGTVIELHDPSDAFAFEDGRVYRRHEALKRLLPSDVPLDWKLGCVAFMGLHDAENAPRICASVLRELQNARHCAKDDDVRAISAVIVSEAKFLHILMERFFREQSTWPLPETTHTPHVWGAAERHSAAALRDVLSRMKEALS